MRSYLDKADIVVEVYRYDQKAKDDLYDKTREWLLAQDIDHISKATKLRRNYVAAVIDAMNSTDIVQLNQLARVKGIGIKTLEKIFQLARDTGLLDGEIKTGQQSLL